MDQTDIEGWNCGFLQILNLIQNINLFFSIFDLMFYIKNKLTGGVLFMSRFYSPPPFLNIKLLNNVKKYKFKRLYIFQKQNYYSFF